MARHRRAWINLNSSAFGAPPGPVSASCIYPSSTLWLPLGRRKSHIIYLNTGRGQKERGKRRYYGQQTKQVVKGPSRRKRDVLPLLSRLRQSASLTVAPRRLLVVPWTHQNLTSISDHRKPFVVHWWQWLSYYLSEVKVGQSRLYFRSSWLMFPIAMFLSLHYLSDTLHLLYFRPQTPTHWSICVVLQT